METVTDVYKEVTNGFFDGLKLYQQEYPGDYAFRNVRVAASRGFVNAFEDCYMNLVRKCLEMLPENPDYLQVFTYRERKFYLISPCKVSELMELPDEERRIQFILADEW